jgi:phosphoglycerol transferase MdoB-like AlkP superfamily enzyme
MICESIYRESVFQAFKWSFNNLNEFFANYFLLFCIINIFYIFNRKIYLLMSVLLLSVLSIFSFVSKSKMELRGEPIVPWDLYLGKEAAKISTNFNELVTVNTTLIFIFLVVSTIALILFSPKEIQLNKKRKKEKISISIISLIIFFFLYVSAIPFERIFNIDFDSFNQKNNTEVNGILLGFFLNVQNSGIKIAVGYDENKIKDILKKTSKSQEVEPGFNPNIIFVLSESFSDPTLMKGLTFNEDPIPYFRSLTDDYSSGTIVNPVFGGGTINSEIEVLTSFSTEFIPRGASIHKYIDQPTDSMASLLKQQGYNTVAVHTFNGWFYERNRVYKELGFSRFFSLEFFNNPEYHEPYVKDEILMEQILKEVKQSKGQDFIYAATMEAHGPYKENEPTKGKIQVTSKMSTKSKNIVNDYVNRINGFDASLKTLITGLESLNEPTIVVVFGDHLPFLGKEEKVYKELGYFNDEKKYKDYIKKYSTSLLVWDNFSKENKDLRMSGSFIAPYVLNLAKKEGSNLTDYLYTLMENNSSVLVRENFSKKESLSKNDIQSYQNLQYDILFGEKYSQNLNNKKNPDKNDSYALGNGKMNIETISPLNIKVENKSIKKQLIIDIIGEGFITKNLISNTIISVNGEIVESLKMDEDHISFILPHKFYEKPGQIEIKIILKDNTMKIIADSNSLFFKVID